MMSQTFLYSWFFSKKGFRVEKISSRACRGVSSTVWHEE